jgi:hypothetical protein
MTAASTDQLLPATPLPQQLSLGGVCWRLVARLARRNGLPVGSQQEEALPCCCLRILGVGVWKSRGVWCGRAADVCGMPNARQRDVQSRAESSVDWGFQYPISSSMHSHMHYKALLYSGIHCALVYAYVGEIDGRWSTYART